MSDAVEQARREWLALKESFRQEAARRLVASLHKRITLRVVNGVVLKARGQTDV